ncbi:MAG: CAP domain-containing protein [Actinomycetota bacterium]
MPVLRKKLALLVAGILSISVLIPLSPAAGLTTESQRLLSLLNSARTQAGLPALQLDGAITSIAQGHAERMASSARLYHNPSYPNGACPCDSWGENVGTGPTVDDIHRGFMSSSTHRNNILNRSYNLVGIGVAHWSQGIMAVEDFVGRGGVATSVTRVVTAKTLRTAARSHAASPPPVAEAPAPPPPPPAPTASYQEVGHYARMARWERSSTSSYDPPAALPRA